MLKVFLRTGAFIFSAILLLNGCVTSHRDLTDHRFAQGLSGPKHDLQSTGIPETESGTVELPEQPLDLERAIALALQNNHTIREFEEDVGIAGDGVSAALSAFLPRLSAGYTYNRRDNPPGMHTAVGPFIVGEEESQRANVTLMMNVWDFGRSLGTYNQARLGEDMAELTLKRLNQQVIFQVTKVYFEILRAKKAELIAEESLAQAKSHLSMAKSFFKQAIVDKNDVLRAELRVAEIEHSLIRANNFVELATAGFNMVLGIDPHYRTEIAVREDVPPFRTTLAGSLELATANRHEFSLIKKKVEFEKEGLTVARSAHYPRIYVAGGYNRLEDDYQLHKDVWMGEVGIQVDLFSGGKASADVRAARKTIRKAEETAREVCDEIGFQVKSAYLAVTEAQKRIEVMEKAVEQAKENLRLMNNKYKQNVVTSTDVVDAEALLTRAQNDYYNAIYDYNIAMAQLENAIGKKLRK
jgi:outer membrane protein